MHAAAPCLLCARMTRLKFAIARNYFWCIMEIQAIFKLRVHRYSAIYVVSLMCKLEWIKKIANNRIEGLTASYETNSYTIRMKTAILSWLQNDGSRNLALKTTRASDRNVGESCFPLSWSTENFLLPLHYTKLSLHSSPAGITSHACACIVSKTHRESECYLPPFLTKTRRVKYGVW